APAAADSTGSLEKPTLPKSPNVKRVRVKNLLHRWVFHRSAMKDSAGADVEGVQVSGVTVKDQATGLAIPLAGDADMIKVGESANIEAIELKGGSFPIDGQAAENLPTDSITVEAWVRVDEPADWGGIMGCIQDDGTTEHGWLLGYRSDKFCLAIAGGKSGLTYLTANEAFQPKTWNHVVGTYNGREMRLYVNGSLAGASTQESGPISYADQRFFSVGAYRDSNEGNPLIGALHEVRIYSAPLEATHVKRLYQANAGEFLTANPPPIETPDDFLVWGPFARYISSGEVEVTYGTKSPCKSIVDVIGEHGIRQVTDATKTIDHRLTIDKLPYRREIQFQLRDSISEKSKVSASFSLDTHFDWTVSPSQKATPEIARLIAACSNPRGLAFVVGVENATRAETLSTQSQFNVVLVVDNEKEAAAIRNRWIADESLTYGRPLCVCSTPIRELPAAAATLVVSSSESDVLRRLVRPDGGVLSDGTSVVWRRKPIEGAGVWSHMYGQADNSAFGGESLSDASNREDLATQWIGRPGPRYQTDRQNRKPSPLAAGGRLFLQGQQRMIALDSYSGTVLWSVESPTIMRWNVPHDCSNWCADQNGVFVAAEDQAWFVDGKTGRVVRKFDTPTLKNTDHQGWGFISRYNDQLLGTVVDPAAVYTKWWGSSQWFDSTGGSDTHVVAGEQLFSMDPETGKLQWQYDGLVLHPTITILDGHIYFVEDKTSEHLQAANRRISLEKDQQHELVCLEVKTGKLRWRRPLDSFAGHIASLYLAGGGDAKHRSLILAASEATIKQFAIQSFDPETGDPNWTRTVAWEATHHGKHISRPAIQGELMYLRPEVLSLADGETIHRGFPGGHGCSSYTLSTNGMFSRLGETTWWDVRTQKVNRFKRIRTDCWISVVPAQGMLLSAEGGGGCSCGTWLETSLGFLPRAVAEEMPEK
ncbi:MAG: outer membrane protein assembly factor BamB, partial [Mariniblastus sp.]